MIKSVNKSALLAIGLMLFAAGASAAPILTYDASHTLVTGVKDLSIGGKNYNATFLGDHTTYRQYFSTHPVAFSGQQALAHEAAVAMVNALNSVPSRPSLLAGVTLTPVGGTSQWELFLVPYDINLSNGLPMVWYVPIHLLSSNFWGISPPLDNPLLFYDSYSAITIHSGVSFVAFTDPPPSAVPAPPTLALMAVGVLALTRVRPRRRD